MDLVGHVNKLIKVWVEELESKFGVKTIDTLFLNNVVSKYFMNAFKVNIISLMRFNKILKRCFI